MAEEVIVNDALRGAIIGAVCGLVVWLYTWFKKRRSTDTSSAQDSNRSTILPSKRRYELLCTSGIMKDRLYPLPEKPICIGTDPQKCSIVYPKNTPGIAPLHCQILPQNDGWLLIDFSDTGTFLGNERLKRSEPYVLQPGDVFYLTSAENGYCFREMTT
ncbi:MAG: FHA domain-containing protein [Selenomonadaceae bacterium]|nr:FHA domain-containing protein [Selenomonadaceae bacterium]